MIEIERGQSKKGLKGNRHDMTFVLRVLEKPRAGNIWAGREKICLLS